MPFWIHGRDASTGQPRDPIFIETDHEDDARKEATDAGMEIDEIEHVDPAERTKPAEPDDATVPAKYALDNELPSVACLRCGSRRLVPRATFWNSGNEDLHAIVYANPEALLFKGPMYGTLHARVCVECGTTELFMLPREAQALYDAYWKNARREEEIDNAGADLDRPKRPTDDRIQEL